MDTRIKLPVYDAKVDGNVFDWLISTAEDVRRIRQRERYVKLKKAATEFKSLDRAEMEN